LKSNISNQALNNWVSIDEVLRALPSVCHGGLNGEEGAPLQILVLSSPRRED